MTFHRLISPAVFLCLSLPAAAGPAVDAMAQCLVAQTNGEERVLMVRWMTYAFAAHPAVKGSVTVDPSLTDATDQGVAQLFTVLLTQRCVTETRAAVAAEGNAAVEGAFKVLGEVASQEAMLAPEVSGAITGFTRYIRDADFAGVLQ